MQAMLKETVAATRRIAADLRPLILDDLGLVPAVEWLVEGFTQRNGIPCELAVGSAKLELPSAHATAVFRIIQESLDERRQARAGFAREGLPRAQWRGCDVRHTRRWRRILAAGSAQAQLVRAARPARTRVAARRRGHDHERSGRRHPRRSPAAAGVAAGAVMIRVVIADDHTIVREGLKQLLGAAD